MFLFSKYNILKINARIFFFLIILFSTYAHSFPGEKSKLFSDDPKLPWKISADEIFYNNKAGEYIAKGDVVIDKADMHLRADIVRYDYNFKKAYASGSVVITTHGDRLSGTSVEINFEDQTGVIVNGEIFLEENHYYINGDYIKKTGPDTYQISDGRITTCDGKNPAWKITGKNLRITLEGYGLVNHATLWTKNVPSFYIPFFVFPVKLKRQTGLLSPEAGFSDRRGFEYTQPFFWALNKSSDFTFYEHHMSKRGDKFGLEYRYISNRFTKGTVMYDFLDDRKVDNGKTDSSSDWGFDDPGQNILRPNSDRYWFRTKQDFAFPFNFHGKLDMDIVSDQDYLNEFKKGTTGYNAANRYFLKNFNREMDDLNDSVRVNSLNISKTWQKYSLNAGTRWYDDVIARRNDLSDMNQQKLPYILFDSLKQQLFTAPVFWDFESDYSYTYTKDGSRGHTGEIHPKLYLPCKLGKFISVEPSIGISETFWYVDKRDEHVKMDKTESRELYDIGLDLSTEIYRIFDLKGKKIDSVKHIIRPSVAYEYIPPTSQGENPSFVSRIENKNFITYSITNTFISRLKNEKVGNSSLNGSPLGYDYHQICRLELKQSYNIDEEKEDEPSKWLNGRNQRPFSPIFGRIELNPFKYLHIEADANWSTYESAFETSGIKSSISDKRGDSFFLEYRYNRNFLDYNETIESIYSNVLLNIWENLSLYAEIERDIRNNEDIESGVGFLYTSQCWAVNFGFSNDDGDMEYAFMVELYGLGGFGKESLIRDRMKNVFER